MHWLMSIPTPHHCPPSTGGSEANTSTFNGSSNEAAAMVPAAATVFLIKFLREEAILFPPIPDVDYDNQYNLVLCYAR
jgi:hypothetical protein